MKCIICSHKSTFTYISSPRDREYFVTRNLNSSYERCLECHSLQLIPRPDAIEAAGFYSAAYQNYKKTSAPLIGELFELLQQLSLRGFKNKIKKDSKILDFGCNQGQFLELLAQAGYRDLFGYDVVPLENTDNQPFNFFSSLEHLINSGITFDVIRMNHVIEHLTNVDQVMTQLSSLLRPKGVIIGQTPNGSHYTSKLFKSRWGALHFPYHLSIFSEDGLKMNAQRWNLTLVRVSPTIVPTGWAMSFENILKTFFFKSLSGRSPIYVLLIAFSAPFAIFDRFFARILSTAIIDFEITKR